MDEDVSIGKMDFAEKGDGVDDLPGTAPEIADCESMLPIPIFNNFGKAYEINSGRMAASIKKKKKKCAI